MRSARRSTGATSIMPLPLSVCFSDTLMRRPLQGTLACSADTGAANCDIRAAVLHEVLEVAALSAALTVARRAPRWPDRATRARAANRPTGD
jgi:hypothetical protein